MAKTIPLERMILELRLLRFDHMPRRNPDDWLTYIFEKWHLRRNLEKED
ncbi:hypothetical protein ACTJJ7_24735 [Phyllobacterium sp. 22229]